MIMEPVSDDLAGVVLCLYNSMNGQLKKRLKAGVFEERVKPVLLSEIHSKVVRPYEEKCIRHENGEVVEAPETPIFKQFREGLERLKRRLKGGPVSSSDDKVIEDISSFIEEMLIRAESCTDCVVNYFSAKSGDDWFSRLCPKPHSLVWAKTEGYPFWPAKILSLDQDTKTAVVAYFGSKSSIGTHVCVKRGLTFMTRRYPSDYDTKTKINPRLKREFQDAMIVVKDHVKKLLFKYGNHITVYYSWQEREYDGKTLYINTQVNDEEGKEGIPDIESPADVFKVKSIHRVPKSLVQRLLKDTRMQPKLILQRYDEDDETTEGEPQGVKEEEMSPVFEFVASVESSAGDSNETASDSFPIHGYQEEMERASSPETLEDDTVNVQGEMTEGPCVASNDALQVVVSQEKVIGHQESTEQEEKLPSMIVDEDEEETLIEPPVVMNEKPECDLIVADVQSVPQEQIQELKLDKQQGHHHEEKMPSSTFQVEGVSRVNQQNVNQDLNMNIPVNVSEVSYNESFSLPSLPSLTPVFNKKEPDKKRKRKEVSVVDTKEIEQLMKQQKELETVLKCNADHESRKVARLRNEYFAERNAMNQKHRTSLDEMLESSELQEMMQKLEKDIEDGKGNRFCRICLETALPGFSNGTNNLFLCSKKCFDIYVREERV